MPILPLLSSHFFLSFEEHLFKYPIFNSALIRMHVNHQ